MHKKTILISMASGFLLWGAGCSSTASLKPNTATVDPNLYENLSTSSVPRGPEQGYIPAPTAPPTSTSEELQRLKEKIEAAGGQPVYNNSITSTVLRATTNLSTPSSLTYTRAIAKYKPIGAYLQFVKCRSQTGTISMKRGSQFMLDNRDGKGHIFQIAKTKYPVPAYGFAIATAPGAGQYYILCDTGGSAYLNVEQ